MNHPIPYVLILCTALGVTGCVSYPEELLTAAIETGELSQHVHFLAQPALRGRKPLTPGSRRARRYIDQRFSAYGLEPWGDAESYGQPFGIGTNMIGVLPGSDPNLAHEVVIVSAHYDHLGRTEEGLCLGACDNAAGVAALLEMAEHLALAAERPRRTICFAAFDQEESALLGALTFSQRQDFDGTRIAGVVNVDLLGRSGFEVLPEHLFVTGTAGFPLLRRDLHQADPHITLLPVSEKLLGARSDHAAFADLGVCTLFFSCGPYSDYHKPGDRADRVDYEHARASTQTVLTAVRHLADTPQRLVPDPAAPLDREEWQNIEFCLQQIEATHESLAEDATQLISGLDALQEKQRVTDSDLRDLFITHFDALTSLMIWPEDPCDPNLSDEEILNRFAFSWRLGLLNLDYQTEVLETGQALAGHLGRHRKRLFWGIPDFDYERAILHDSYLHIEDGNDNQLLLTAIPLFSSLSVRPPGVLKWPPRLKTAFSIGASWKPKASQGTREELLDICLLGWGRAISEGEPNAYWGKIVARVSGKPEDVSQESREQWLAWRLETEGYDDPNEWTRAHMQSSNPYLAHSAIRSLGQEPKAEFEPALVRVMTDTTHHPLIRTDAMAKVHRESQPATRQALVHTLDDPTPLQNLHPKLGKEHPHRDIVAFIKTHRIREMELWSKLQKPAKKKKKSPPPPKTVGEAALKRLKDITGKDFKQDKEAWQRWIERHG
jgi:hypothetical protein